MTAWGTILLIAALFAGGAANSRATVPPLRVMAVALAMTCFAGGLYQNIIAGALLLLVAGLYLPARMGEARLHQQLHIPAVAGFVSVALAVVALRMNPGLGADGALGLAVLLFGIALTAARCAPVGLLIAAEGSLFVIAMRETAPDLLFTVVILLAILLAVTLPEAPPNVWKRRSFGVVALGGAVFAAVTPNPALAWGGLALAALAGAALDQRNQVRLLSALGLIIALFGLAVAGAAPVLGGIAILVGYGVLACGFLGANVFFAALPSAALLAAAHTEILPGVFWIALGIAALITGIAMLARRGDLIVAATLGQAGIALAGFGFGGGSALIGGALLLTGLGFARLGAALAAAFPAHPARRMIGNLVVIALAGLPPFGSFAGIFLILSAAARHSAWFTGLFALLVLIFIVAAMTRYAPAGPPPPERAAKSAQKSAPAGAPLVASGAVLVILTALGIAGPFFFAHLIAP